MKLLHDDYKVGDYNFDALTPLIIYIGWIIYVASILCCLSYENVDSEKPIVSERRIRCQ